MKHTYSTILRIQHVLLGEVKHEVTVRKINNRYHCRIFTNGVLNQEAVCSTKNHIGYTCRSLLRTEYKCGNISNYADRARFRVGEKENGMRKKLVITVIPFRPIEGYKVQNTGLYSEQYLVKYTYTGDDAFCKFGEEIFCTENSREAHQQVENFAKNYLSTVKNVKSVKITSVTYC